MTSAVNSLEQALEFAMRTIAKASDAVTGKATELITLPDDPASRPPEGCPVSLPKFLAGKDHRRYLGYYHTDITVPSEYFLPDVTRPASIKAPILSTLATCSTGPPITRPSRRWGLAGGSGTRAR